MKREITLEQFRRWLILYAQEIADNETHLTELDAAIGDADHGVNMHRGMALVRRNLEAMTGDQAGHTPPAPADIGALLRGVAMTLISNVGGAAGPLYGAFFLWAAKSAGAQPSVTPAQLAAMLRMGLEGIQQRGKARPGEKTMLDVLAPAVEALEQGVAQAATSAQVFAQTVSAAHNGMEATVGLQAMKGRASYLGARSIGHMDPGAASAFLLIRAAAMTLGEQDQAGADGDEETETQAANPAGSRK